jgi:hypothetical protein
MHNLPVNMVISLKAQIPARYEITRVKHIGITTATTASNTAQLQTEHAATNTRL